MAINYQKHFFANVEIFTHIMQWHEGKTFILRLCGASMQFVI